MSVHDYNAFSLADEVAELFRRNEFNFGKGAIPIEIVREAMLKSVCGLHNGSTAQSIIVHLGYVETRRNKRDRLTSKGKAFMWHMFNRMLPESEAIFENSRLHGDKG